MQSQYLDPLGDMRPWAKEAFDGVAERRRCRPPFAWNAYKQEMIQWFVACKLRGHGEVPSYPSFSTRLLPSVQKRQCEDGHPCPVFALQVASHALEPICYQWRYWLQPFTWLRFTSSGLSGATRFLIGVRQINGTANEPFTDSLVSGYCCSVLAHGFETSTC